MTFNIPLFMLLYITGCIMLTTIGFLGYMVWVDFFRDKKFSRTNDEDDWKDDNDDDDIDYID